MMKSTRKNAPIREAFSDHIFNIINLLILTALVICVLYPLYFIVTASFTDPMVVNRGGLLLYPKVFYAKGYTKIFHYDMLWMSLISTQIYNLIDNYNATAITDGNIDDTWDAYITSLENAGLSRYLEIVQKTYDAYSLQLDLVVAGI